MALSAGDADRVPAAPSGDRTPDGVVAFAGVDWWYHNRGHSECQILRRLAADTPVLWVNSMGMRTPRPGRTELPWRRWARKARSTLKGLRRDPSGLWVLSPLYVPRFDRRWVERNGRVVGAQVRLAMRHIGIRRPAVWITLPTAAPAVADAWRPIVFNRSDEFSAFPEVDADLIGGLERHLLGRADHTLYVNRELLERERDATADPLFLGHGVDHRHFARGGERPEPPALDGLPRPLVGFYGALDDYTIDLDCMVEAARAVPDGTLVVIGPQAMEIDRLTAEPNVVYLGPVSYEELPAYAARFDVGIMPWLRNEWIARSNPIKLKEYLACGFPVATTDFPALEPYRHLCRVASGADDFADAVRAALAEVGDEARRRARRDAVRGDEWSTLAERCRRLLALPTPGPPVSD